MNNVFFSLHFTIFADRTSLRNLHGNTSGDGNSNSQYEIAKQILEDDSSIFETNSST